MVTALKCACPDAMIKTVSNGMLLDDKVARDLIKAPLDAIEFSLDGQNPTENNLIRRNCDYNLVTSNIQRLISYKKRANTLKPEIYIATTQFIRHDTLTRTNCRDASVPEYIKSSFGDGVQGYKSTFAMRWPDMIVDSELYEVVFDPYDTDKNVCDHVLNTMTIRWNGDVVPCCHDLTSQLVMGNVLTTDLAQIWNNENYMQLRKGIFNKNYNSLCANCNQVRRAGHLVLKNELIAN